MVLSFDVLIIFWVAEKINLQNYFLEIDFHLLFCLFFENYVDLIQFYAEKTPLILVEALK